MRPSRPFLGRTSYLSGWRQFRGGGGLLEEDFNYRMASKFHICLVCGNAETSDETNAGGSEFSHCSTRSLCWNDDQQKESRIDTQII